MNPAIDRTIAVDRLAFDDRAYILSTNDSAGGRGINASCVIHNFGGKTLAILPAGGEPAVRFEKFMDHCGFPVATVPIRNDIRLNLTITDRHGLTVKLNEAGPRLDAEEVANVESTVEAYLGSADWLMLCGSLPPSVPADFYAHLIQRAHKKGVRTLLDTDGDALSRGIEAEPTIVTPNQQEAEHLLNAVLLTRSSAVGAARRIQAMGAKAVVLSLGSRGAIGAMGDVMWEAIPPRVEAISPIGAGDAMAAALLWSIENGEEFPAALAWGVAAGTASAKLPGMQFASLEQARAIRADIDLRKVEQ